MTATIIDGAASADKLLDEATVRISQSTVKPGLAVIIVGENAASKVYVRNKIRACEKTGVQSFHEEMPDDVSEETVLAKIAEHAANPAIHGILLQLPLPAHINAEKVLASIPAAKDVDGFHASNMGRLVANLPSLRPCTPAGCMFLLEQSGVTLQGANAVVIGRSNIVGKPMAMMLINAGATVTVCHSKTKDLGDVTRRADIVVAAVGRARMITGDMLKQGSVVIDVGINRLPDGTLAGDVDFDSARQIAAAITPVPGGVGRMTIAMLVLNTLQAAGL